MFRHDRTDRDEPYPFLGGHHHHRQEFIISGFRLIASDNGVVIAASYWGKFKTTFQMVMICLMIANFPQLQILTNIIMWIALILTVVSLIDYLVKNKDVMKNTK